MSVTSILMGIEDTIPKAQQEQIQRVLAAGMCYIPLAVDELNFNGRYKNEQRTDSPIFRAMDLCLEESGPRDITITVCPEGLASLTDAQIMHGILLCCAVHQAKQFAYWYGFLARNPTLFSVNQGLIDVANGAIASIVSLSVDSLGVAAEQIVNDTGSRCTNRFSRCRTCGHEVGIFLSSRTSVSDMTVEDSECPECGGVLELCDD